MVCGGRARGRAPLGPCTSTTLSIFLYYLYYSCTVVLEIREAKRHFSLATCRDSDYICRECSEIRHTEPLKNPLGQLGYLLVHKVSRALVNTSVKSERKALQVE